MRSRTLNSDSDDDTWMILGIFMTVTKMEISRLTPGIVLFCLHILQ